MEEADGVLMTADVMVGWRMRITGSAWQGWRGCGPWTACGFASRVNDLGVTMQSHPEAADCRKWMSLR